MENTEIRIGGMMCEGCVKTITGVLTSQPGVGSAVVSLAAGKAEIAFDPASTSHATLVGVIEDAGFDAE